MILHFENKSIASIDLQKWKNKDFFLSANEKIAANFIKDWYSARKAFVLQTSGSTGIPKQITIKRELLEISAQNTLNALEIPEGSKALICINTKYIGGTMMLVRALHNSMDMYFRSVSSNPLDESLDEEIDLCAMVPLQLNEIIQNPNSLEQLAKIKNLLIGGGTVSDRIVERLQDIPTNVYHTYGMTETISHVALRKLNGPGTSQHFKAVGDNTFKTNDQNQLIISGAVTESKELITNDIVNLINLHEFEWMGRFDNVINSGGVKFFPEQIERKISVAFSDNNITNQFFITAEKDDKFGEIIVLAIEGEVSGNILSDILKSSLDKYEIPKKVYFATEFIQTETGKINRSKTIATINEI